jgi:quinol monooxygenase YgiN
MAGSTDVAYVVIAKWLAQAGKDELVLAAIQELTPLSRAESACRSYQACRSASDPCEFVLFEVYDDEAGYQAHLASDHFQRLGFGRAIPALEDRQRSFYETID